MKLYPVTPPSFYKQLPHEISWYGFHLFVTRPGPLPTRIILPCYQYSLSHQTSLFACLRCEFNRDNSLSDPILFHLEKAFVSGLEQLDADAFIPTYFSILKRHEKINRPSDNQTIRAFVSRFSRQR